MKKLLISVCALGFALCSNAQAVVDNAVIPVSVNINSIMRMNVVSGGNIEFSFNTIQQYTNGIANSPRYDTKFTVASSVDFEVLMYTEDKNNEMLGADDASHKMPLKLVAYNITDDGNLDETKKATLNPIGGGWTTLESATNEENYIVKQVGGDISANAYTIHWSCGVDGQSDGTVLSANLAPDRYSTNIFLVLSAQKP